MLDEKFSSLYTRILQDYDAELDNIAQDVRSVITLDNIENSDKDKLELAAKAAENARMLIRKVLYGATFQI